MHYDGDNTTKPWRRFLPGGELSFDQTFDFFHDKQHELFVVVTDNSEARKAISWVVNTHVQNTVFKRCDDNQNTLPSGHWYWNPANMLLPRG